MIENIHLDIDLLKRLSETPGLPGREHQVSRLIRASLPPAPWQISSDCLGNLVARLPGTGPRVMLVAHMDEVGLVVRKITNEGFLLVDRLGGMTIRALPGSRLNLWTDERPIPALVGLPPQHLDKPEFIDLASLYMDIGVHSKDEAQELGVQIGDGLTWNTALQGFGKLQHGQSSLVSGKALDDRAGCFVLITLARQIERLKISLPCDLYLAFVVQEETMLHGGLPVAQAIQPDILIGIDGTLPSDTPDTQHKNSEILLGHGPAVKIMDAIRGKTAAFVPDWGLAKKIQAVAKNNQIPLQKEVVSGISTAITPLPFASPQGIRTAGLSIPIRYHHSPVETASFQDIQWLIILIKDLILSCDVSDSI